ERNKSIELLVVSRGSKEKIACKCSQRVFSNVNDERLARLYSICDIFVYPSLYEGFGLCGLEAMACGAPVVLTDSGGVREYAIDGENCLMVSPKSAHLLAEAIIKIVNDKELSQKLRQEGIKTARQFTLDKMVTQYEEFFERTINKNE
ncbi:MAG: glycosyltransferase family 4 protein, partial [Candidatus Stahlbacteria bacterium]|nr:glycosyltransferase family 4 protein [Candidatus Stahlbacteria bacterium]